MVGGSPHKWWAVLGGGRAPLGHPHVAVGAPHGVTPHLWWVLVLEGGALCGLIFSATRPPLPPLYMEEESAPQLTPTLSTQGMHDLPFLSLPHTK